MAARLSGSSDVLFGIDDVLFGIDEGGRAS
jgi:hypothetical protein